MEVMVMDENESLKKEVEALRKQIASEEIERKLFGKLGHLCFLTAGVVLYFSLVFAMKDIVVLSGILEMISYTDQFVLGIGYMVLVIFGLLGTTLSYMGILEKELEAFGKWVEKSVISARDNLIVKMKEEYEKKKQE